MPCASGGGAEGAAVPPARDTTGEAAAPMLACLASDLAAGAAGRRSTTAPGATEASQPARISPAGTALRAASAAERPAGCGTPGRSAPDRGRGPAGAAGAGSVASAAGRPPRSAEACGAEGCTPLSARSVPSSPPVAGPPMSPATSPGADPAAPPCSGGAASAAAGTAPATAASSPVSRARNAPTQSCAGSSVIGGCHSKASLMSSRSMGTSAARSLRCTTGR